MILELISQAFVIILLLTFSFGPAFFALINAGIKEGYRHGAMLALGIVLSDLFLCIGVCILIFFGAGNVLNSEKAQVISSIIGGGVLIVFGITYFIKKTAKPDQALEKMDVIAAEPNTFMLIVKGFLLNLFNPSVWLLWLANATAIGHTMNYSLFKMISFFVVVLALVFGIELGKVFLAGKIKRFLTDKTMHIVNYITGAALIVFGIILICKHI